ncbi:hypothetical protein C5167_040423 [Papaver somniferum]|uniref:Uncharacterized protein n=1 Tax=Papaver somniferum TaxID=3469 RepID=A0A4Y7IJ56_PAPSO|nr:hypothetical protein C5167_040423 [Papaver somniferum]
MECISTRYLRTFCLLIMFLLISFNLLTTIRSITPAKDDNKLAYNKMNINISRKLLRVKNKEYGLYSPFSNPPDQNFEP